MKTTRLHTIATAAAVLTLLSGMLFAAPAGQRTHRTMTRDAEVTTIPAPVVDDTPINPDTVGKIKREDGQKNVNQAKQLPKRRINRR
jgi:hypothetical protein